MKNKVLLIGDSRKMKGGISTVIKTLEKSPLWKKYNCYWLETQINSNNILVKILYLLKGFAKGLFIIPQYRIIHFHTATGASMKTLLPFFLYTLLFRKKIIIQLHVGNQIKKHVNDYLFKFWTSRADLVLFLGKTWQNEISQNINCNVKTDFLYNPIYPKEKQLYYKKYFLFAAYFHPNKGYDILLEAFSKVIKKHPEWKLIMCGTGDTEGVYKSINKFRLNDNVILPGWVKGEDKEVLFKEAFAYCMTSYQEGLPMSVLESLSYGVPVISTPVGCLPEFLSDNESVLFFNFGNVDKLEKCMLKLIEEKEIRELISQNAYKIINSKFTIDVINSKLDTIYNNIINHN